MSDIKIRNNNSLQPFIFLLVIQSLASDVATAAGAEPLTGLSTLSESDIRASAIAFVNTTTSPGLEGATLTVDTEDRDSKQWRSALGFSAEFTLKDYIFNGYWGLAILGGSLRDNFQLTADNGDPVNFDLTRDVISLRVTGGLSFPVNQHLKLRPVLSLAISDVQSKTLVDGLVNDNIYPATLSFKNTSLMTSTTGSIDALYTYWRDDYSLELSGHYNLIYTDSFSEDNPIFDTHAWNQTAQVKSRISGPTSLITSARPWRWQAYANHTNFISHDKSALGYTGLFDLGVGLEWQLNIKPLDWFGWQFIGISAGIITSRNVEGYNVGITAR